MVQRHCLYYCDLPCAIKILFFNCLVVTEGNNRLTVNDAQKTINHAKKRTYFAFIATPTTRTAALIGLRRNVCILTHAIVQAGLMPSTVVKI